MNFVLLFALDWRTSYSKWGFNLFTTIHDGNFRRHSSMNVTIKWHKFSSNIYYIYVFFVIWSWKLRQQFQLQMTKNRTRTPVYLDPGMHPGLEVKGLNLILWICNKWLFLSTLHVMYIYTLWIVHVELFYVRSRREYVHIICTYNIILCTMSCHVSYTTVFVLQILWEIVCMQ